MSRAYQIKAHSATRIFVQHKVGGVSYCLVRVIENEIVVAFGHRIHWLVCWLFVIKSISIFFLFMCKRVKVLRTECHKFHKTNFIEFIVVKFDCLACDESKPHANGALVLGDEIINRVSDGIKIYVRGAWGVYVICVPLLEMDEDLVEHFAFAVITRFVTVGNQTNLANLAKLLCPKVASYAIFCHV
jgi:hypothetical protein